MQYIQRTQNPRIDTKFVKNEVIPLKVQLLQSVYFLLFSWYLTHHFVLSQSQNKLGRQDVPFNVLGHIYVVNSEITLYVC